MRLYQGNETVGKTCNKCGARHKYDPVPPEKAAQVVELEPRAEGWVALGEAGTNRAWDICGTCWPAALQSMGGAGTYAGKPA